MMMFRLLAVLLLLSGALTGRGAEAKTLPLLTSVQQVRALNQEEGERGYPVRLRGVLTFHDWGVSYFQDATGGIFLRNLVSQIPAGTEIELEGVTELSNVGRKIAVIASKNAGPMLVRPIGPGRWPHPIKLTAAMLTEDEYDTQWVSVSGNVKMVSRANDGVMLDLESDGVLLHVMIPRWPPTQVLPGYLRDLLVNVCGVMTRKSILPEGEADPHGSILMPSIETIEIAPRSVDKLFNMPDSATTNFSLLSSWETPRLKIRGQVEFVYPGRGFFIAMNNGYRMWVQTSAPGKITLGDFVNVVGWLQSCDEQRSIADALFRVEGPGTLSARVEKTASFVKTNASSSYGRTMMVEGTLVEHQAGLKEDSFMMEDQGVLFLARLPFDSGAKLPVFERGMRLRLGGVCVSKRLPDMVNTQPTFTFQLWLNAATDVEILRRPPWWTVERVAVLCVSILFLGLLATGWAVLLRRQVARQSALIATQIERHAVAQERARIARELHDSLGQDLVGITLQLDTVALLQQEKPQQAEEVLNLARRMIRHSQAETKRSVADLRAVELDAKDFPTALEELLQPLIGAAGSAQLHLEVEGRLRRLQGVAEHHLLRIVQEAVTNAVRHGHPEKIEVKIRYQEAEVLVEVKDNGCGFDLGQARAAHANHFGLLGLQERVNKLQGRLQIESCPGAGTVITVTIPANPRPES